jgi:hypothetical protein
MAVWLGGMETGVGGMDKRSSNPTAWAASDVVPLGCSGA